MSYQEPTYTRIDWPVMCCLLVAFFAAAAFGCGVGFGYSMGLETGNKRAMDAIEKAKAICCEEVSE